MLIYSMLIFIHEDSPTNADGKLQPGSNGLLLQ